MSVVSWHQLPACSRLGNAKHQLPTLAPCSCAAEVSFFASKGSTTAPVCDGSSMTRYIQLSVRAWTGMTWGQLGRPFPTLDVEGGVPGRQDSREDARPTT